MEVEPQPAPQRPADLGVSTSCPDNACLYQDITADELSQCIKRLKQGKSPGNDGILADMIEDGGDLVQQCLLWLFNCMLASTSLNVCLLGSLLRSTSLVTNLT